MMFARDFSAGYAHGSATLLAMRVTSFSLCGSCQTCDVHVRISSRVLHPALCPLQMENVERSNDDGLAAYPCVVDYNSWSYTSVVGTHSGR